METKIIIFIVFAVVVQRSTAVNETSFMTQLAEIRSGEHGTVKAFHAIIEGFFDTMRWLADVSSRNEDYDPESISELESIEKILLAHWLTALQETQAGVTPVTVNASAFTNFNVEELVEVFEIIFSPFYEIIEGKNYSESAAAIDAIETIAMPKFTKAWISIYDTVENAVSSENLVINNAIRAFTPKGTSDARGAISAIFAGFKILLLELSGETQFGGGTFLSAMETERNFARILLSDEAHTKFILLQYIATARYLNDTTIMTNFNQIQFTELGINNEFEYACESLFTTIIELAENGYVSCTIEALSDKLTASLYPSVLSGVVTFSDMQPEGSSIYGINQAAVYNELQTVSDGITDAIKLTQKSNTCGVRVGIERIEKKVITVIVDVYEEIFITIENIARSLGHDALAVIESSSKKASIAIDYAFTNIFAAIKMLMLQDTFGTQPGYCDTSVSPIKTARDGAFAGVKNETLLQFDAIRIFHLFEYLKAHGISVPLELLLGA